MAQKPRYLISGKDMIWSLIPLLAICAVVAMVSGNCSVGLTGGAGSYTHLTLPTAPFV